MKLEHSSDQAQVLPLLLKLCQQFDRHVLVQWRLPTFKTPLSLLQVLDDLEEFVWDLHRIGPCKEEASLARSTCYLGPTARDQYATFRSPQRNLYAPMVCSPTPGEVHMHLRQLLKVFERWRPGKFGSEGLKQAIQLPSILFATHGLKRYQCSSCPIQSQKILILFHSPSAHSTCFAMMDNPSFELGDSLLQWLVQTWMGVRN